MTYVAYDIEPSVGTIGTPIVLEYCSKADTLPWSAAEGQMVQATSPSLEGGSLPQLVRHPSKETKAEETRKKGKMITKKFIVQIPTVLLF